MSSLSLGSIAQLGREIDRIHNAAFDLWTWLPSYKAACDHHGDGYHYHQPPIDQILVEASKYLARHAEAPPPEELEGEPMFECPCEEVHQ